MKCYVLLRRRDYEDRCESGVNANPLEWAVPKGQRDLITLFVSSSISTIKQYMLEFIDHLEPGRYHHVERDGYHLYARTYGPCYFGVATDTELTEEQLRYLCRYLLIEELDMQTVADDCQRYLFNRQLEAIKDDVDTTTDIMKDNIKKMQLRGEALDELKEKTAILEEKAIIFHHEAAELNRCWPSFCRGWFSLPTLPWPFK